MSKLPERRDSSEWSLEKDKCQSSNQKPSDQHSSRFQDMLLEEVSSPNFVLTGKIGNLVVSVFLKLMARFFESPETKESASVIEKHLALMNEIVRRDSKFLEVILKVCSTDLLDSLTLLLDSPVMSCRFTHEMSTLLLGFSKFSTEKDKSYLGMGTIHSLLTWIQKLGIQTKPDCLKLLKNLAESPPLTNFLRQKENFDRILDLTVSVLSEEEFNGELGESCLDLLMFLCEDRPELMKKCAEKNLETCLLEKSQFANKLNIQQFSHKISCSRKVRTPLLSLPKDIRNKDSGFYLSLSDLKAAPPRNPQPPRHRKVYLSRGSFLPTSNLSHHVFLDVKNLEQVTGPSVVRAVCGLLNTGKGGFIYSGVDNGGLIQGLEASRSQRDSFRCGIDQYLRAELEPTLSPSLIDVRFSPVHVPWERNPKGNRELFILSICVPADMGGIYASKKDGKIYLHKSANNIEELNLHGVRQLAVELGKKEFEPIVEQLERELQLLEQSRLTRSDEFDLID